MSQNIPILSKKQQNKSNSLKKKPTKSIRNVYTSVRALHWPLITKDDETKDILNQLSGLSFKKCAKNDQINKMEEPIENDARNIVKFGINEVIRHINKDDCQSILIDGEVPRILVAHVVSMALSKSITLLCIKGLSEAIKHNFGFKSISMCFTCNIMKGNYSQFAESISKLCHKYFNVVYNERLNSHDAPCPPKLKKCSPIDFKMSNVSLLENNASSKSAEIVEEFSSEFIELKKETLDTTARGRKRSKKYPLFQPLVIKRIRNDPDRRRK